MATTQNTYTGNGSLTTYSFTFPYLEETDIKVSLDGVDTSAYTLANATTINFNSAPANGVAIRIYRVTNTDSAQATFFAGSAIRAQDLNDNTLQVLYATQETVNRRIDSTGGTMSGQLDMGNNKIVNLATPTASTDAATKNYVDTVISAGVPDGDKGDITVSSSGTAWSIDNNAVTSAKLDTNIDIAGTLDVTGAATLDSTLDVAGTLDVTGVATFTSDVTINSNGAITIPDGTNAQRPTGVTGMIRFNTDLTQFEGYNGSAWSSIGGGATGGGADQWAVEHDNTVTVDYTISTGKNVISAGPMTINSGITVTVPSGSSWVVV